jgi:predicted Zn-dependent peptidase
MYKRVHHFFILLLGFLLLSCQAPRNFSSLSLANPKAMRFSTSEFRPPKPQRVTLSNGITLFLMEDHELPLIQMEVLVRTGSIYDSPDQIGLAGLAGAVMRTGGTATRSGDEVDRWVDQVAAELSVGIGLDAASLGLDILKKDFDAGLALLAEVLRSPAFAKEKLEVVRNNALEAIRRRNDHPGSIARRWFGKHLYGKTHPYAREATQETLQAITRDDLVAFHRRYFVPNQTMIGVTGDFDTAEMIGKIEAAFSGWKQQAVVFPEVAPAVEPAAGLHLIHKPISQTQIRIGHLGIRQDNPDFFALSILDDILGAGGFSSRLFSDVRTRQGLAYSVGSLFRPGHLERGVFVAYAETRAESTAQTISAILGHLQKIREEPVSEEEWRGAREAFLNAFIFSFASPAQVVSQRMSLEYYGLPPDYLEQYRDNVTKVTREDILRVAREYLHPDRLVILAVGDKTRFSLNEFEAAFGPVQTMTLAE